jgi:hypothetical protein
MMVMWFGLTALASFVLGFAGRPALGTHYSDGRSS